ncbi:g10113 [Coccomyxa elongata]
MLRSRSSRPDRQALARSHGGLTCSKLLVTAAVSIAACIVFLNSNRILNVDLHGGSRVRLRVKQGLPFDDALPGAAREAEHPWYDSAEQRSGSGTAANTNLPSSRADYTSDGVYTVDGMDSAGVLSAEARMDQLRGKVLNREAALEGDGINTDNGMENIAASGGETWREQVLGDIVEGDGSIGKQDAIGPRGKQDNGYLDSSGSRSSADAHEDRIDTVRDSQGETEQDPSAGIGEEQNTGDQEGPYDEGAMSEGTNSGEEEDTWMVKLYKEMEQKSKEEVKDPALEAGSRIFDVEASEPAVQRLLGLLQMDAVSADNSRDAQEGTGAKHIDKEHTGQVAQSQLKLVGLYSDEAGVMPHSNPKLATWEEDLAGHLGKVEDAKKIERARLQTEQEALYPAIPQVTGVLDPSKVTEGAAKGQEEENRPARLDDLLEAEELEQHLREEGRLDEILEDPELIPDWNTQYKAQESRAFNQHS